MNHHIGSSYLLLFYNIILKKDIYCIYHLYASFAYNETIKYIKNQLKIYIIRK
jgi:hypothetical protein